MVEEYNLAEVIKKYVELRDLTLQEVSDKVNMNYKTFLGRLKRNAITADLLLDLANILDIDLYWLSDLFGTHRSTSIMYLHKINRMSDELRKYEYPTLLDDLDSSIKEYGKNNISMIRKKLIKRYHKMYYILDVILPENIDLKLSVERNIETCYCFIDNNKLDGKEALNIIIKKRGEEI